MYIKFIGQEIEEVVHAALKNKRTEVTLSHMSFFDKLLIGFRVGQALSIGGKLKCKDRVPTKEEVSAWITLEARAEHAARLKAASQPAGGCGCGFR